METVEKDQREIVKSARALLNQIAKYREEHGPHITYAFCYQAEEATEDLKLLVIDYEAYFEALDKNVDRVI